MKLRDEYLEGLYDMGEGPILTNYLKKKMNLRLPLIPLGDAQNRNV